MTVASTARKSNDAPQLRPYGFQPGQSGNPAGRPKGSRNKLTEDFISTLQRDFAAHGESVIAKVRETNPTAYLSVVSSIVPKRVEKLDSPFVDLTDDELDQLETFLKASRAKDVTPTEIEVMPDHRNDQQNNAQPAAESSERCQTRALQACSICGKLSDCVIACGPANELLCQACDAELMIKVNDE